MKIVILDGYCVNPGDRSWEKLVLDGRCSKEDKITTVQKKVSHVMMWVTPGTHNTLGKARLESNRIIFS